jgi:hypothetical protein
MVPAMSATVATAPMKPATVAAASMEATATTVEASTTVEPSTSIEAAATPEALMIESAASETVVVPGTSAEAAPAPAIVIPVATPAAAIPAVIPRARADEHAIDKPLGAVVAVRRARVRVIIIIAVGAYRCPAIVGRAHTYAYKHSLRTRK